MTAAVGPAFGAGRARPGRPAARSAAARSRRSTGSRSARRRIPSAATPRHALAARGLVGPQRVSARAAGRPPGGARGDRSARAGAAGSCAACWWCCSMRRCSAPLWLVAELIAGVRAPAAAVAQPGPLVPHPPRRHAGRVLPPARHRLRGLELRAAGRGGRAEPRPADHPDAARRGAHGAAAWFAAAVPPPDERLRELSRRIDADLALYLGGRLAGHEHPGARGPRA